jgi:hypothetical protein
MSFGNSLPAGAATAIPALTRRASETPVIAARIDVLQVIYIEMTDVEIVPIIHRFACMRDEYGGPSRAFTTSMATPGRAACGHRGRP